MKQPTAGDFVRMMEAWAAYEIGLVPGPWDEIYKLAHVCFEKPDHSAACPHPEWVKAFWKRHDSVSGYWKEPPRPSKRRGRK